MRLNVAEQLKSPLGTRRDYTLDETTAEGRPLKGQVVLVRTNRSILVTGNLITVVESTCSRCLEQFCQPVEFAIEEEYFPPRANLGNIAIEAEEDIADSFFIEKDNTLDLSEAVRQNTLISFPAKPVCKPDCAGLCPQCGNNLNTNPCHCSKEPVDPRWSPLREIFSR